MRITEIRETAVRLETKLRNAAFSFDEMTTSIVAVVTDVMRAGKPVVGYAFNSTGRYACGAQIRDRLAPRVLKAQAAGKLSIDPAAFDPDAVLATMMVGEKPGGDMERSVGIGTIEVAIWDAVAKIAQVPAYQMIAGRYRNGKIDERVFCYVGGGWYLPGKGIPQLLDEVQRYLDWGYTLIKIKVGGMTLADDVARIEAVLNKLGDPKRLALDANCGIGPDRRPGYAAAIKPYGLRWFEEPAHPVNYAGNADFIASYGGAVATGENLFSVEDVVNLARYGGMRPGLDIIQCDTPQSYGIGTLARMLSALAPMGWNASDVLPHGGNMMSLNFAAGFGLGMCEAYPDAFGVFSGYADDLKLTEGILRVGDWTGFGFERQKELSAMMQKVG
jgi:D(-)-tartrate dehydratase